MKTINKILCFSLAIILFSCHRDRLYYATEEVAIIRFNIDWSKANLNPNGTSAYIFDANSGNAVCECQVSNSADFIDVALPVGVYDVFIVNDTEEELININFADTENLSIFKSLIATKEDSRYKIKTTKAEPQSQLYTTECSIKASTISRGIVVTPTDIQYAKERPQATISEVARHINIEPTRTTELFDIEVVVNNLTSANGAPRSLLTDVAQGNYVGLPVKYEGLVTHEFVLNNRVIDPINKKNGKISKTFTSFGPIMTDDGLANRHFLVMDFILINGEKHLVEVDVTDLIETTHNDVNYIHTIRLEITLPVVIGNGDGAFNPDVEDWEDAEVELPI